jgi:hypothetical protein
VGRFFFCPKHVMTVLMDGEGVFSSSMIKGGQWA